MWEDITDSQTETPCIDFEILGFHYEDSDCGLLGYDTGFVGGDQYLLEPDVSVTQKTMIPVIMYSD